MAKKTIEEIREEKRKAQLSTSPSNTIRKKTIEDIRREKGYDPTPEPPGMQPLTNIKNNFTHGKLQEDENKAWNDYRTNQTPESLSKAQQATKQREGFASSNQVGYGNVITKDFAQYVPQLINQTGAGLKGAAPGAVQGATLFGGTAAIMGQAGPQIAMPEEIITVPGAAAMGAYQGGKAGYVKGVAEYSYNAMAGAAYKNLLDLGVPNDIALKASGDEAFISSLIEASGAVVDVATLGVGKLFSKVLSKPAENATQKAAQGVVKSALKAYGANLVSETLEEAAQEKVSIETEKRAMAKAGLTRTATGQEDWDRIKEAGRGGFNIALVSGGLNAAGNITVNKLNERQSKLIDKEYNRVMSELPEDSPIRSRIDDIKDNGAAISDDVKEWVIKSAGGQIDFNSEVDNLMRQNSQAVQEQQNENVSNEQSVDNEQTFAKSQNMASEKSPLVSNVFGIENVTNPTEVKSKVNNYYRDLISTSEISKPILNRNTGVPIEVSRATINQTFGVDEKFRKAAADNDIKIAAMENIVQLIENGNMQIVDDAGKPSSKVPYANITGTVTVNGIPHTVNLDVRRNDTGSKMFVHSIRTDTGQIQVNKTSGIINNGYERNIDPVAYNILDRIGQSTCMKIKVVPRIDRMDSQGRLIEVDAANGQYDAKTNTLEISMTSENPVMVVAKHEITHMLQQKSTELYREYKDYVISSMKEVGTYDNVYAEMKLPYDLRGIEVNESYIHDEIVADATELFLTDKTAIEKLVNENRSLGQKILDVIREFIQKVDEAVRGVTSGWMGTEQLRTAERMWVEALDSVAENEENRIKNTNLNQNDSLGRPLSDSFDNIISTNNEIDNNKFSLKYDEDNNPVVFIDTNIFEGREGKKHDIIADYIAKHIGEMYTIIESGQKVYIGEDLPGEYTHSKYTQRLLGNERILNAKNQASQGLGELIEIATNRKWNKNEKEKHKVDAKYGFYYYTSRFAIQSNESLADKYTARLIIRNDANGKKYLYDIQNIKKTGTLPLASTLNESAIGRSKDRSSVPVVNDSISKNDNNVKSENKYSLKESFSEQIDKWVKGEMKSNHFYLGSTPHILVKNNIPKLPMIMTRDVMEKVTGPRHEVSIDEIRKLPGSIAEPVLILKSDTVSNAYVVLTELKDSIGRDVIVAIHLNKYNDRINVNRIASLYGRNNVNDFIIKQIEKGNLVAATEKSQSWFTSRGLQLPKLVQTFIDSNNIISKNNKNDNKNLSDIQNFNPDDSIKHQLKNNSDEIKRLKEVNARLKEQFKITKGVKLDKSAVNKLGRNILKDYNSSYSRSELENRMYTLYDKIANDSIDFEDMQAETQSIARDILESASVLNDTMHKEYAELRKTLRNTAITLPDKYHGDFKQYNSFDSFRKKNFGRMNLTNDGMGVDVLYQELSEMYPELFLKDIANPSDQLMLISDVLDGLMPVYENPFDVNMNTAVEYLSAEIFENITDVPQAKLTFADKKKTEKKSAIDTMKYENKERINRILEQQKDKRENAVADVKKRYESEAYKTWWKNKLKENDIKSHYQQMMKELRTGKNKKIDETASTYRERIGNIYEDRNMREAKTGIARKAKRLDAMLRKPTEKKHINKALEKSIAELLTQLDFSTDRQGEKTILRLRDLRAEYEKIAKVSDEEGMSAKADEYIMEALEMLNGKRLADMNLNELGIMHNVVSYFEHMVNAYNKAFINGKWEEISEKSGNILAELKTDKPINESAYGGMQSFKDMMNWGMLTPQMFFRRTGETFTELYSDIRASLDNKIENTKIAQDYMKDLLNNVDKSTLRSWTGNKAEVKTFKLDNGNTIELKPSQIMSLYLLLKREQARGHIFGLGVKAAPIVKIDKFTRKKSISKQFEPTKVTASDVHRITRTLSKEQKRIADGISKFLNTYSKQWVNEATLQNYGYELAKEENYFPIKSDKDFLKSDFDVTSLDPTFTSMGFLKGIAKGAGNAIIIEDIFDVFTEHADKAATYNAFLTSTENMKKVINFRTQDVSIKQSLNKKFGPQAFKYLEKLMHDLQGGIRTESGAPIVNSMLRARKRAVLGMNVRVIAQQPTAIVRASALIDMKYLAKGISQKSNMDEMLKYSPIAQWKSWGYFTLDTGRTMKDIILDTQPFLDKQYTAISKADDITWAKLWNAVKLETEDVRPELKAGSKDYFEAVSKRFSEIIDETQVVDTVLHRSDIMRQKDFSWKITTNFMAEPTKSFNMLLNAVETYKNKPNAENKKALTRVFSAYAATTLVNTFVVSLIDAWRDKEDEEFINRWFENLLQDPVGMFPIVKEFHSLLQGYDVKRMEYQGLERIARAWNRSVQFADEVISGEKHKYPLRLIFKDWIEAIGETTGVSVRNLNKELEAILRNYMKFIDDDNDLVNGAYKFMFEK